MPQGRPESGGVFFLASTASSKPFLALSYTKNKANNQKNLETGSSEVYALGLYHLLPLLLIITFWHNY